LLSAPLRPYLKYSLTYRSRVRDPPRPIAVEMHFGWSGTDGKPYTWSQSFRPKGVTFTVYGFLEYVTKTLACEIEGRSTSRGNQQFRFIGVKWEKEKPK